MTRDQSSQAFNAGMKNQAQDQQNAQISFQNAGNSVSQFNKNLQDYMTGLKSTYGSGGEFMKDQNTIANTTAKAASDKIGGDLALNRMRTGENTAGYAGTLAEATRAGSRDLTDRMATADATRLGTLNQGGQFGVDASKFPASVYESMYGTSLGGSTGSLDAAQRAAAANSSFGDMLLPSLIGAGGELGSAAIKKCWVAAELYGGWEDPRTIALRRFIFEDWKTLPGRAFAWLYLHTGERVARLIHYDPLARAAFKLLFDRLLARAQGGNAQKGGM